MVERTVVLGDVVGSRDVEERRALRQDLEAACESLDESVDPVAPFAVLKGVDEVGGVLDSVRHVYDVVETLGDALHPEAIRLVAVTGEVDVWAESATVAGMDGPAFHRADALLSDVEDAGLLFGLETGNGPLDTAIADEVNLLAHRRLAWSDRQREVVETYRRVDTQSEVARRLDVSQQAVSNVLDSADWSLIRTVENRLRSTLASLE